MPPDLELWLGLKGSQQPLSPSEVCAAVTSGVPSPGMAPRGSLRAGGGRASPGSPTPCRAAGGRSQRLDNRARWTRRPLVPGNPGDGALAACFLARTCSRVPGSGDPIAQHLPRCPRPAPTPTPTPPHTHLTPLLRLSFHLSCSFAPSSIATVTRDRAYFAYLFIEV